MNKKIILVILQLCFLQQFAFAFELDEGFGIEKALFIKWAVQKQLNLTDKQQSLRNEINEKYSPLFNEKFYEIGTKINELRDITDSETCSKEQVDRVVQDFKIKENELCALNKTYEREIRSILNPIQKIKYSLMLSNVRIKLKKDLRH